MRHGPILTLIISVIFLAQSCSTSSSIRDNKKDKKMSLYYQEGTRELKEKNYRVALGHLLNAYQLNPTDSKTNNNLGLAYFFLHQKVKAKKHFLKAYQLDNTNIRAYSNYAAILQEERKFDEAIDIYNKVLNNLQYRNQFRTYYNLALIYQELRNFELAKKYLKLSLKEKEDYCPANFKLGEIAEQNHNYNKALSFYKDASLGTCYRLPEPILKQAKMYIKLRDYKNATDRLNNLIARFSNSKFGEIAREEKEKLTTQMEITSPSINNTEYESTTF